MTVGANARGSGAAKRPGYIGAVYGEGSHDPFWCQQLVNPSREREASQEATESWSEEVKENERELKGTERRKRWWKWRSSAIAEEQRKGSWLTGAADYTPQCESQPLFGMGNNSIKSGANVYTSQGESQPHFVMGSNSIKLGATIYTSQGESQPRFVMGSNSMQLGAAVYTSQGQSQSRFIMGNNFDQDYGVSVYISQSQSRFVMGSNYNKDHRHGVYISQSQPRPQVLMGATSGPPFTYGTYDGNNMPQSMPSVYPTHRSFQ
ncbi:hypothetical protein LOK49_LG05G01311 [Camellia lanceoleosa]|uniref:Uncharacterized protein n=1 Tax=Camellia lanceoleosa TaxID=1840588 RepID=A0ACC0HQP3_9ERIC|nr:hypothetical protein LOK49_LG05G01311 [Camellia lanceoleosa]